MTDSADIPQLDKVRFVGPVKNWQKIEAGQEYLEINQVVMPPEKEKSPERERQIEGVVGALLQFARDELKVNLSKRIPSNGKFHFFDDNGYQKIRQWYGRPSGSRAMHLHSHILVWEKPVVEATLGSFQHELIHVLSHTEFNLYEIGYRYSSLYIKGRRSGYTNYSNLALVMVDEALTEMTNLEVMAKYWPRQPALNQMNTENYEIGYMEQVIIMDELVKRIADKNNREYEEVLLELQRGKFLGEMQALRVLTQEVGKDGMKILARWKWTPEPQEQIKVARLLGLATAEAKIKALIQHQEVPVMERIAPGIICK